MSHDHGMSVRGALVGLLIVAAVAVTAVFIANNDPFGRRGPGLGREFVFDPGSAAEMDPALIKYRQARTFPVGLQVPRAIAVDKAGRVYVAGDKSVQMFALDGVKLAEFPVSGEPYSLAVADDGKLYAGMRDHVEVFDSAGVRIAQWPGLGDKALLTSIAVRGEDVAAADYGSRSVVHYSLAGEVLGRIGAKDAGSDQAFILPSHYFDVAFAPDGLLRVANPGKLRVEAYTLEGDKEFQWGAASAEAAGFQGCCNPAHVAIFPDGRIATSEKGAARVKVYKADRGFGQNGLLDCVVAGPDTLGRHGEAFDLALDSAGRVFILDTLAKLVRVYEPVQAGATTMEATKP